jgi:hypothetical protein
MLCNKGFSNFLLLHRWHIAVNWSAVRRDLCHQRSWCLLIYHETFCLFAATYQKCVGVLDYCWINPLLEEWGQKISLHCGTAQGGHIH